VMASFGTDHRALLRSFLAIADNSDRWVGWWSISPLIRGGGKAAGPPPILSSADRVSPLGLEP
jgi:hypothetical protein